MIKKIQIILALSFVIMLTNNSAWALTDLERVSISDTKLVNAFGAPISELVNVNQQVQISADIKNNQEKSQKFVYIVQIKDENDVVVSLGWISGMLSPGQNLSPALSWSSKTAGTFTAEIFVWEGLINQNALSEYTTFVINTS